MVSDFLLHCFHSLKELASRRRSQLNDALMLQQLYRDISEEEAWIK